MRALVVSISTRSAAGVYPDRSGPLIAEMLEKLGFELGQPVVVPDGPEIETILLSGVHDGYDVVITTGGTGLSPNDVTPEYTSSVITRQIPGIPEAMRTAGRAAGVATAALSRGVAGLSGHTLIVNLPGSPGGVRDGLAVLEPLLIHAVEQAQGGGDHGATA